MTGRPFDAEDLGVMIANMAHRDRDGDDDFEMRLDSVVFIAAQSWDRDEAHDMMEVAKEAARNRWRTLSARGFH